MKTVKSAGTLIQSGDKYLMCHSTNFGNVWGIPKGLVDAGENEYDAAVRETMEETGINLVSLKVLPEKEVFAELKFKSFHDDFGEVVKHLYVFLVKDEECVLQHEKLKCDSLITNTDIPEIDGFRWCTKEEATRKCAKSLRPLFAKL